MGCVLALDIQDGQLRVLTEDPASNSKRVLSQKSSKRDGKVNGEGPLENEGGQTMGKCYSIFQMLFPFGKILKTKTKKNNNSEITQLQNDNKIFTQQCQLVLSDIRVNPSVPMIPATSQYPAK